MFISLALLSHVIINCKEILTVLVSEFRRIYRLPANRWMNDEDLNKKCPQSADGLDFSHIISGLKLYYSWEMNFSFSQSKERKKLMKPEKSLIEPSLEM